MATQKEPQNASGTRSKMAKANGALGVGFVGLDTYMNMKEGDNVVVAGGKALATNALWSMAPGGLVGGMAIAAGAAATQVAPAVATAMEQKRSDFNRKRTQFGGSFQSTQAQEAMQYQGINQIQASRQQMSRNMAGHARGAARAY